MVKRRALRVNAIAIAELMVALQHGCHSMVELADICGLTIGTVRNYLKQLHKRGAIHIVDWREDKRGARTLKVYELGIGKDMPKPKRMSSAEACARWKAKRKQAKLLSMMASNDPFRRAA